MKSGGGATRRHIILEGRRKRERGPDVVSGGEDPGSRVDPSDGCGDGENLAELFDNAESRFKVKQI